MEALALFAIATAFAAMVAQALVKAASTRVARLLLAPVIDGVSFPSATDPRWKPGTITSSGCSWMGWRLGNFAVTAHGHAFYRGDLIGEWPPYGKAIGQHIDAERMAKIRRDALEELTS